MAQSKAAAEDDRVSREAQLWQSIFSESEPVEGRPEVFKWRGRVLQQPQMTPDGLCVIVEEATGSIVFKGLPPVAPDGAPATGPGAAGAEAGTQREGAEAGRQRGGALQHAAASRVQAFGRGRAARRFLAQESWDAKQLHAALVLQARCPYEEGGPVLSPPAPMWQAPSSLIWKVPFPLTWKVGDAVQPTAALRRAGVGGAAGRMRSGGCSRTCGRLRCARSWRRCGGCRLGTRRRSPGSWPCRKGALRRRRSGARRCEPWRPRADASRLNSANMARARGLNSANIASNF